METGEKKGGETGLFLRSEKFFRRSEGGVVAGFSDFCNHRAKIFLKRRREENRGEAVPSRGGGGEGKGK